MNLHWDSLLVVNTLNGGVEGETDDRSSTIFSDVSGDSIDNFGPSPVATLAVNNSSEPTPPETEEDMLSVDLEAALQLIAQDPVQQRMSAQFEN